MTFLKNLCLCGSLLCSISTGTKAQLLIKNLTCEYLTNPQIIENKRPLLSWQMLSLLSGKSQKAYRIIAASSPTLIDHQKADYWDSGKISSASSTQVVYLGKVPRSRQKIYWKVMVWDESNKPSPWSDIASWRMGLDAADWKAKWIGASEDSNPDAAITYPAPYFRKSFVIAKKIKQATVYVSGLGFYELYINGKKIGDQVLAPAVTNYDTRPLNNLLYPYDDQSTQRVLYNAFDVTKDLTVHDNAVGILLGNGWYNQRDRTVEGKMWYGLPKLIFQLEITYIDGTKSFVGSDNTWKTSTGPLLKDGIFSGEHYDARLELGDWNKPNYSDTKWKTAIYVKPPTGASHAQTAPFDKIARTLTPIFDGKINDSVYQYHLNETVAGWAGVSIAGKAGSRIKLRYISEEGEDYGQVDTYILKGGVTENWAPKFTWHAFRKIEVISNDVELNSESIYLQDVHTAVAPNGTFECSNPLFNKINVAYLKTQLANLHGSISSDCPHRERLGYTGDGQVAMESALLSFNMPNFYRKWFDDINDARNKKTGFVTHTAPFGGGGGGPAWGSAYVIMPWLYYNYYGDSEVLQNHYPGMKQWVNYLKTRTNKDGLIDHEEPNGWCLGDWCTPTRIQVPEPLVNTAYYYHVTATMAKVAGLLGNTADRTELESLAQQIKADFNKAYYDPARKTYWQGRQGADVFALAFGLVPQENYPAVFNALLKHLAQLNYHFDTGILATPLLLKVLSENNRDDIAYKLMDQKSKPGFAYLLDDKNSTLWEEWNGGGSHAHPMFGSVVSWFYSALGGIKPGAEGLQHFSIEPKPLADLIWCKTSYNSLYGKIRSEWKRGSNGNLEVLIEVPSNTSASFILPGDKNEVKDEAGKTLSAKAVDGKKVIQFQSGVYRFEIL